MEYRPFELNCSINEEFGILKLIDSATRRKVNSVYIKVFSRYKDGKIKFYKDGYTDLNGSFNYVSLNLD